jgi:glycosyltransferase involved in cell wall biosynthesis
MKIAMIGQRGVPASFGGVERHVEEIGSRLAAEGHDVVVFCRKGYGGDTGLVQYHGMRLAYQRTVNSKHLESFVASASATLATVGRGYDVIHFHAVGPGLFTPLAQWLTRARVVQTIHGLDAERVKWGRGASFLLRTGTWMSAKVPDATIVVSGSLKDAYRHRYGRDTVHIVNGVPDPVHREADIITRRWGLTPGSYVLSVGRLVPEKAPELLIEAFRDVVGDVRLVIAGGSSHTDEYVSALQETAADDPRVILTGYVFGAELEELYSNAALFVLPSLLEGLPLSLLEAISYGLPVVASDIAPHIEIIGSSGPGAHLVPVGEVDTLTKGINEALQAPDDEERAGAAELSERVCSSYTWSRAARETADLYERLASERRVRASIRRRLRRSA